MEMNKLTNDTISKPIEVTETQNFKTKFNISKPDFDLERNSSDSYDPYTSLIQHRTLIITEIYSR